MQKQGKSFEAISATESQIQRSQALELKVLTVQDANALTKEQHFEEEEQRRAKKEEENSCKPSKRRRFLGNQHTKSTPKPTDKPPPAAATLKKRCFPLGQDSSEKTLENVSKVLDMETELEDVVGLLVGEEL